MQVQRRANFLPRGVCSSLGWVTGKQERWAEPKERRDKLQRGAQMPGQRRAGQLVIKCAEPNRNIFCGWNSRQQRFFSFFNDLYRNLVLAMTRIDQHNLAARITCLLFWKQWCSYFFDWSKKRRDDPSSSMAFRLRRSLELFSRTPLHRPVSPIASFFVTWCFYCGSPCIRVAEYSATEQHRPPGFTTRNTKKKKKKTWPENLPGKTTGFLVRVCCTLLLVQWGFWLSD